jgi:multicomponent Na+:H+ antiporter subunit D
VTAVVALCVVLPLLAGALVLGLRRMATVRDVVTVSTMAAVTGLSAALLADVDRNGTVVLHVGGWAPELGIVLVADLFASMVLLVASATILVVEMFAIGQRRTPAGADPAVVSPILLVLAGGVSLAILTGDLFTLFVAFELILVSSYVLLTHQGHESQVRSGMTYVVINLFASTLFLFGVAIVYSATGTVNMALLAERIPELPGPTQLGIGLWFLVVFGTKAAIFPLFSWLPDSYPTAPTSITAVFAGLLTKIGVYVLIRFFTLMELDRLGPLLLVIAGFTMIVGVAGALAQDDVKRILSFHVVSQIGYMIMGLGLFTVAGVAGAVLFLIHQIPVKTVMFLAGA